MNIKVENLRFDHYLTATYVESIRSFILPILRESNLNHFSYSCTHADHSGYCLTTDPEFSELFISEKMYKNVFMDDIENYVDGYYLWDSFVQGTEVGKALFEHLKTRSGITIIRNNAPYFCEFFHFGTSNDSYLMNHYFVNNQDYFNSIADAFDEKFEQLIELANNNRVIYPSQFNDRIFSSSTMDTKFLMSLSRSFQEKFTKREKECAFYIKKGLSAKEIARNLSLSSRTIEKHIESLKRKTHSTSIKKLIINLS